MEVCLLLGLPWRGDCRRGGGISDMATAPGHVLTVLATFVVSLRMRLLRRGGLLDCPLSETAVDASSRNRMTPSFTPCSTNSAEDEFRVSWVSCLEAVIDESAKDCTDTFLFCAPRVGDGVREETSDCPSPPCAATTISAASPSKNSLVPAATVFLIAARFWATRRYRVLSEHGFWVAARASGTLSPAETTCVGVASGVRFFLKNRKKTRCAGAAAAPVTDTYHPHRPFHGVVDLMAALFIHCRRR